MSKQFEKNKSWQKKVDEYCEMAAAGGKMKKWYVVVEQNSGEYYGHFEVQAYDVRQVHERSICADGVIVRFDERIDSCEEAAARKVE